MDAIAGNSNDAFDKNDMFAVGFLNWLVKDDNISTLHLTIVQERNFGSWRECLPLHQHMIANQKRACHRGGWNHEILKHKGQDEKPDSQDTAGGCKSFGRCFTRLLCV